ncbi:protoporphyrinogen oxidase HemJ [Oceanicella actignis]|uniref:protoporphyrinogen oxidase HemJ n=1 Tax=Oceanicella actignis TaxID=1189325 RepID=UPI0011E82A12|nr:protoporphyrinogen oxidase HemJ [Oceanicella actignis]TYO88877.1 putative membrane protein [Oceanicella actignis]
MTDWLAAHYDWLKALHVMSVIAWMAGIFYLPRLFVYHAERGRAEPVLDETFKVMERRLYRAIMVPAMISSWIFGASMLIAIGLEGILAAGWLQAKLALVVAMTIYHEFLGREMRAFQAGANRRSGRAFRMINEIPTLLMVLIVIMAIVEPF